jgi:hypothetical protein
MVRKFKLKTSLDAFREELSEIGKMSTGFAIAVARTRSISHQVE